jgi:hypothetical protein
MHNANQGGGKVQVTPAMCGCLALPSGYMTMYPLERRQKAGRLPAPWTASNTASAWLDLEDPFHGSWCRWCQDKLHFSALFRARDISSTPQQVLPGCWVLSLAVQATLAIEFSCPLEICSKNVGRLPIVDNE